MNTPKLPKGSIISNPHFLSDAENLIKEHELKEQHKHDYKVELFGGILGGMMGLITSIIFWLISK